MSVSILDDQTRHEGGRVHCDMKADWRAEIVKVDAARTDGEVVEDFEDCVPHRFERCRGEDIGLSKPRKIGSDDKQVVKEHRSQTPKRVR
jgi:hypothetical protein